MELSFCIFYGDINMIFLKHLIDTGKVLINVYSLSFLWLQINISQKEYEEKYRLYLELTNTATERRRRNSPEMMSLPHAVDEDGETDIRTLVTIRPSE